MPLIFQFVFDVAGLIDSVMISLEQRDVTAAKQIGQKLLRIGFQIFKVLKTIQNFSVFHSASATSHWMLLLGGVDGVAD